MILEYADDNDLEEIISNSEIPVVVLFITYGHTISENFQQAVSYVAEKWFQGIYLFLMVDIYESRRVTKKYDINEIPAILVFAKDKPPHRYQGLKTDVSLKRFLDSLKAT